MPLISRIGAMSARGFGLGLASGGPVHPASPVIFTTTGAQTWTVPAGVNTITIEGIGSGSNGVNTGLQGGGGGGAYSTVLNLTVSPGQTVYLNVPAGNSGDAWVNISTNSAPGTSSSGIVAKGGSTADNTGGQASSCIGTTAYSGGDGGIATNGGVPGGGGAAGPGGAGKNGGTSSYNISGDGYSSHGGGGGCNGGSSTAGGNGILGFGGNGGNGPTGTSGGAGGAGFNSPGSNGSNGSGGGGACGGVYGGNGSTYVISAWGGSYGPGSGSGGGTNLGGSAVPGLYGGGDNTFNNLAAQGIIVIS